MPNRDGTGPTGQGPIAGRGRGRSVGRGLGRDAGRQTLGGTAECMCPKCGYKETHKRGIPCTGTKCPKCGTTMKGEFCK